jgi:hypothetical protein
MELETLREWLTRFACILLLFVVYTTMELPFLVWLAFNLVLLPLIG